MTISGVRAVFVAALAAMLSLYPAMSQQGPGHPMATPPKPITAPHRSPAQLTVLSAAVSDVTPSLNSASWTAIGPAALDSTDPLSGRITGVAVDPTASTTIYVGAAGGGVWKTTDGGTTWTPLTDTQPDLAIGAIAVAPTNNLRIYAGTGEANNSLDSNRGVGILVSSDGGTTWTLNSASGALTGTAVGQIAVDPTNADIAYAAVGGYGFNNNYSVNEGIWKTTNGGTTWTNVTAAASLPATVDWSSVVVDPNTPAIIYAAMGDYVGGASNGVYRSTNSGSTWALLANAPNGTDANLGRIALAVSPAAATVGAHVLYVASAQSSGNYGIGYFERSDNADAATPTFTNLTSTTPDFLGGENLPGEGWYAIALNVDANGNVYCAGEQNNIDGTDEVIWSSNLGVGWTDISIENTFEPPYSEHAIAFDSSNNMILGGDGGIYSYNSTTPGWTDLNGDLNTIQFQGIGLHPTNSGTVIGGSQGNGTELYSGSLVWTQVRGADGGPAKISQSNGSVCYHEYNGPSLEISTDGCATWTPANAGIISSATYATGSPNYFDTYTLDPTNGDHVVFGTDYVNESTDGGTTWTVIGTSGTKNYNPSDLPVDSVALSPTNGANPEVVYAATGGTFATTSQIFVAQGPNGTSTAWTEADLPTCAQNGGTSTGCRVHQIVTDPNDKTGGTAFAVTNDFSSGAGGHVFRTVNKGGAWTDVSSSLPNEPVWSIQVDTDPNKTAYISTDAGVYSSPSPYSAWTLIGTGLPNAQGYDLELNSTLNILGVGTHGRGAWEIETPAHVKSVSSTDSNGTYTTGSVIPITMTFSNTVTVTGTPQLTLNTSPAATASYVSGSGTVTLTFNYTVVSGQTTIGNATGGNLDYASSGALSLNGGTISDASSTAAELTLYAPGGADSLSANKSIVIGLPTPPALTTPAPGSTLSGAAVTFHWSAGVGSTGFSFVAGTTGTGSYNLYNSGVTTALSAAVTGIPTTGATLYVRLGYRAAAGWKYIDYTYTEAGGTPAPPVLTTPAPGSILSGSAVTFGWSAGVGSTGFSFVAGTTGTGSYNLYNSGVTTALTAPVTGIPTAGATLYVRLGYRAAAGWKYIDYTYTEAGGTPAPPALTTPAPGSILSGSAVTFHWSAGVGSTPYSFAVGTTGTGSYNLYNSGVTTALSAAVTSIPTTGATVYVRLGYRAAAGWMYIDYTYKEAGGTPAPPALTTPAPGSTLSGAAVTFNWSAGVGSTPYSFVVGTTGTGSYNLYNSGVTTALSAAVTGIPTTGATVYVRLGYRAAAGWMYIDYTYKEAGSGIPAPPALTTPAPGSTLSGSAVTFGWSAGVGSTPYSLVVGTTGTGSYNVYNSGVTTALSAPVTGIPTTGATLYVRLGYRAAAGWMYIDYTYKEAAK